MSERLRLRTASDSLVGPAAAEVGEGAPIALAKGRDADSSKVIAQRVFRLGRAAPVAEYVGFAVQVDADRFQIRLHGG